jgi:hypothetical protein
VTQLKHTILRRLKTTLNSTKAGEALKPEVKSEETVNQLSLALPNSHEQRLKQLGVEYGKVIEPISLLKQQKTRPTVDQRLPHYTYQGRKLFRATSRIVQAVTSKEAKDVSSKATLQVRTPCVSCATDVDQKILSAERMSQLRVEYYRPQPKVQVTAQPKQTAYESTPSGQPTNQPVMHVVRPSANSNVVYHTYHAAPSHHPPYQSTGGSNVTSYRLTSHPPASSSTYNTQFSASASNQTYYSPQSQHGTSGNTYHHGPSSNASHPSGGAHNPNAAQHGHHGPSQGHAGYYTRTLPPHEPPSRGSR